MFDRFLNMLLRTTIDSNVKPMQNISHKIQAATYFLSKYHSRQKPVQSYKERYQKTVLTKANFKVACVVKMKLFFMD